MIYDLAFAGTVTRGRGTFPGLLRASKELRADSLPRFYTTTAFYFAPMTDLIGWLRRRPNRLRKAIRRIDRVYYGIYPCDLAAETRQLNGQLTQAGLELGAGVLVVIDGY